MSGAWTGTDARTPGLGKRLKVVAMTVQKTPANARTGSMPRWPCLWALRRRAWGASGPKPRLRGFKASNGRMVEKMVTEIVAPHLDPPERAVVIFVDLIS